MKEQVHLVLDEAEVSVQERLDSKKGSVVKEPGPTATIRFWRCEEKPDPDLYDEVQLTYYRRKLGDVKMKAGTKVKWVDESECGPDKQREGRMVDMVPKGTSLKEALAKYGIPSMRIVIGSEDEEMSTLDRCIVGEGLSSDAFFTSGSAEQRSFVGSRFYIVLAQKLQVVEG